VGEKKRKKPPTVEDSPWRWVSSHLKHLKWDFLDGALVGAVSQKPYAPQPLVFWTQKCILPQLSQTMKVIYFLDFP
jgi:hypothetical protein